ncbi:hypothetical protein Kpho01_12210 [Kitasatospora phosalacinea]|uniref:N-acetyltransferase domain-containing protein n=1 Tax=Kitasatospora phosalacinea TaxID=2065 RepID=A0A9W6PCB8_9ACTN|nr:hypothetical protein Kpho01_12210 [Kitasatospora phosalacinea]
MTVRHPELTVRPLRAEERETWHRNLEVAFGGDQDPSAERELWRRLIGVERSPAVWSGGRMVGGGGSFDFRPAGPGGAALPAAGPGGAVLPAAGVVGAGVLPTDRRRGALTALVRRQLDDVRAAGEPLAVPTASGPVVYGRFGWTCRRRWRRAGARRRWTRCGR